jgi:hypothetical protein
MSKRKKEQYGKQSKPAEGKPGIYRPSALVVGVAILVTLGFLWWKIKSPNVSAPAAAVRTQVNRGNPAAVESKRDLQKLKGGWRRPDGGYVLAIKSVGENGAMEATYFNPNPIHVAKAEASQHDSLTRVFIELRDVNYPGSTYTLTYEPSSDQLKGIYYQAVERQNFEVVFERMK